MKLVQMFYNCKKMGELFFEKNELQTSFDKESICFVRTKDIWTEFTEFQTLFYFERSCNFKTHRKNKLSNNKNCYRNKLRDTKFFPSTEN